VFFPSFIPITSIVSINYKANLDAQNAGNGISVQQNFKNVLREYAPTHVAFGHCYPPLISNDKL
jgi:hypothetical protein